MSLASSVETPIGDLSIDKVISPCVCVRLHVSASCHSHVTGQKGVAASAFEANPASLGAGAFVSPCVGSRSTVGSERGMPAVLFVVTASDSSPSGTGVTPSA